VQAERKRDEATETAKRIDSSLDKQLTLNTELTGLVPEPKLAELKRRRPELFQAKIVRLTPELTRGLAPNR
jgi:hypothetical protein